MSIFSHFQHINLTLDQRNALDRLQTFIESDNRVFVLQGYAGTGKTTLIKGLSDYLEDRGKSFEIMAPTGRAAKVLRDKTGQGKTIHSSIYNLEDIKSINNDTDDVAKQSVKYYFPINFDNHEKRIIIVDEASMISNKESKQELFEFGSSVLLGDLLTYAFTTNKNNKLIFVGDPAQLPPVTDNQSCALNPNFFTENGYKVQTVELTEVKRQTENLILENATTIRDVLKKDKRTELSFEYDNQSFTKLNSLEVISTYLDNFPNPEIGDGVIISFSNKQCYHYNNAIRERVFPHQKDILSGDLILINNNNYHTYAVELFNGDIAKVIDVSNSIVTQSAPVYVQKGSKQERVNIKLDFRKITIRVPNHDGNIDCYIIDSLLNSIDRDLTPDEMKALYINFVIRFNEEQELREQSGLRSFKVGSEEFKTALKNDPFYNALKVKYGYAITCHKAQGGEWDKVFVDYSGRIGLFDDALRWCYTATTRGVNVLYALNPPTITTFSKLKFSQLSSIGILPKLALNFEAVEVSPFHNDSHQKCKSLFYWNVLEKLENTKFKIINVESMGDYLERYTVKGINGNQIKIQASHKGSGHFIEKFKVLNGLNSEDEQHLEGIFNSVSYGNLVLNYSPTNEFLEQLYSVMQAECNALDITISNVAEEIDKYYVTYYLITDSICAFVQFYFNKNFAFTRAIPKCYGTENDEKLNQLIKNISSHAS